MQIADDCVVSIHFELANDRGELLDRSRDGEPLVYLHGVSGILPLPPGSSQRSMDLTASTTCFDHCHSKAQSASIQG